MRTGNGAMKGWATVDLIREIGTGRICLMDRGRSSAAILKELRIRFLGITAADINLYRLRIERYPSLLVNVVAGPTGSEHTF